MQFRPAFLISVCGIVVLGLSACGSGADEETRRFANERQPTSVGSTATITRSTEPAAAPTVPPVVSPGALLATRGAPMRLFFTAANELWTVGADGADPRALLTLDPDEGEIRATAQAPGVAGENVATLITSESEDRETSTVILLDGTGDEIRRVDDVQTVLGEDAANVARVASLTWSPQGNQLLVTYGTGGIVSVPIDGNPTLVLAPDAATGLQAAAWSPAGDAIAFLATTDPETESDARRLIVAPASAGVLDPAAFTVASRAGDGVGAFAWLPDGSGLIYTENGAAGVGGGGDLFSVAANGDEPRLIASAGRAAPVARIVDFAVSPDGRSLAYTIATPDSDGEALTFHSLWVRSLANTTTVAVPIPGNLEVTELWWTADGLVWRSQPTAPEAASSADSEFSIERLDTNSQQSVLFSVPPAATPGATAEAASDATPAAAGTPEASPVVASPAASPAVATPGTSR